MLRIRVFSFFSNQYTIWFEKNGELITNDELAKLPSRFRDLVISYHNQVYSESEAETVVSFFIDNFSQYVERG